MMKTIKLSFIFILLIFAFFLLVNWKKVIGWSENKSSTDKISDEEVVFSEPADTTTIYNVDSIIVETTMRDQLRQDIVDAVNEQRFDRIDSLPNWHVLSPKEREAIEVLFWGIKGEKYTVPQRRRIERLLRREQFRSIEDIIIFVRENEREIKREIM